jgi:serine phosphatase RsbU (regulator of sigma subunit)
MPGETLCGDQLGYWSPGDWLRLAAADGLGHGVEAHRAAVTAMQQLREADPELGFNELFVRCDQALLGTRGVALAVIDVHPHEARIVHASVGNVRALLLQPDRVRRLGGARGIVGAGFHGLRPECFPLAPGDWLILYSDGIAENADFATAVAGHEPNDALAERLLERWASPRDDASLMLYRHA